ncbi:unnamed protein product [marine sediment metagenome]|uniref:Uncharacterized protein n=1 Tax=marine sediment metagenome TaxID=412755 RepID=X1LH12_9ZZZZ
MLLDELYFFHSTSDTPRGVSVGNVRVIATTGDDRKENPTDTTLGVWTGVSLEAVKLELENLIRVDVYGLEKVSVGRIHELMDSPR